MAEFRCDKCDKEFGSREALNMHSKSKHKELYKEPIFSKKQKKWLLALGVIIILALLAGGFYYLRSISLKDAPLIEITPSSYNFGSVSQAKGTVSTIMTIRNNGATALVLNNMDSSCGCTSAAVVYNGLEGPRFSMSMHGTNPKNWQQVIPPGSFVELKVYYDPNVHREMRGSFTRSIMIYSNDPRNKIKEVKVSGVQTD